MDKRKQISKIIKIIEIFDEIYPGATCSLHYKDPLQLLISTQLAAQCTDKRVNIITQTLFNKYRNAGDFAGADLSSLEQDIKPAGIYRNKAKNIKNCCIMIVNKFNGKVPENMEDLLELPGVGRKTANLVLGDGFGIPGIVVDTHTARLSNRIGLTEKSDPVRIESDLREIVPEKDWIKFGHQLVFHGRAVCSARKPDCGICKIRVYCDRLIN